MFRGMIASGRITTYLNRHILILFFIALPCFTVNPATETSIILKKGETLYRIAKKYDIPVDLLMKYNGIMDPTKVKEGTQINLPFVHTIKKGDTLYSISNTYNVSIESILEYNAISVTTPLKIGRKIIIPLSEAEEGGCKKGDNLLWPHPGKREVLQGKLNGIAIHGKPGDTIISVSSGKVVWAGPYRGYGRIIFIKSNNNYVYVYAGNEKVLVEVGDSVFPETPLGILGRNAHDGIARVFFCVYRNRWPVDPYKAPRN
jgi:murein DD-endopeptidase MepM/ murein hydrolase activator NlpD